jgi:muramoyltetrapeptide carboxypeptidase
MNAYQNPDVKAILCSRGGYGVVHLLDKINPELIRNNPKWLIGYSDITALHALSQNCGVASLHAPMARHLAEEDMTDSSIVAFSKILRGQMPDYTFDAHPLNREGECNGVLRGGNLSVLQGLRGTSFDMKAEQIILFIEDIGEKPYQVERMMYNLKMGGFFEKISGLIVGQFTDYEEDIQMHRSLYELIGDVVSKYTFPVAFGFPVGHVTQNMPLLCGCDCLLKINKSPSLSFCLSE